MTDLTDVYSLIKHIPIIYVVLHTYINSYHVNNVVLFALPKYAKSNLQVCVEVVGSELLEARADRSMKTNELALSFFVACSPKRYHHHLFQ